VGIYGLKPEFRRRITRFSDGLVRAGVSADALTWIALLLSLIGGVALALALSRASRLWLIAVPICALLRTTLNALDGMVATASGTARPFGEFFNELTDRVADAAWFVGLGFVVGFPLALGTLAGILISSYAGTVVKAAGGRRVYQGIMGKADRMILLSLATVIAVFFSLQVLTLYVYVVAVGVAVTLVQRILIARRELRNT
jgi:CDP-diacylglycerol--glycerol-3-phosphate 3-phosphatidyltransferase